MVAFKKYITCIMAFFNFVTLRNYRMREKKIFCRNGCFTVSRYIKGNRKSDL